MANIATGFLSGLGSVFSSIGSGVGSALSGLAPLIGPGTALASTIIAANKKQPTYVGAAMPGGTMAGNYYQPASLGTGLVPGGPQLQLADYPFPLLGGADVPSTSGGALLMGPSRMPRTIEGKDARGRTRTYVLAPMVKYRVSISRAGRRCKGGR